MKKHLPVLLTLVVAVLCLLGAHRVVSNSTERYKTDQPIYYKTKVIEILEHRRQAQSGLYYDEGEGEIVFSARVLEGEKKGEVITATQVPDIATPIRVRQVQQGDKIIVFRHPNMPEEMGWLASSFVRTDALLVLALVCAVILLLFSRGHGLFTMLSLCLTGAAIFMVLIPAILSGRNIYLWSILTCIFITAVTMLLVNGFHKKTLAAALGCIGGAVASGLLTKLMEHILHLNGLVDEDSYYLLIMNLNKPIDLRAVVFAAILLGGMGAIMDVSVSIASALHEIFEQMARPSFATILRSGFVMGRDMIGTMANTLVLAYIGGSLSIILLLVAYNSSTTAMLNSELLVVEMLQSLVGIFGILLTVPLTSCVCAFLFRPTHSAQLQEQEQQPLEPVSVAPQVDNTPPGV